MFMRTDLLLALVPECRQSRPSLLANNQKYLICTVKKDYKCRNWAQIYVSPTLASSLIASHYNLAIDYILSVIKEEIYWGQDKPINLLLPSDYWVDFFFTPSSGHGFSST